MGRGLRLYCRRLRKTYIIVMRSAIYQQVTCMIRMMVLSWSCGQDFRCLADGRQTTTLDTTYLATSTSTTAVCTRVQGDAKSPATVSQKAVPDNSQGSVVTHVGFG